MGGSIGNFLSGGQQAGYRDIEKSIEQAQQMMPQYYEQAIGYMQPYQEAGVGALGGYEQALSGMADPYGFYQRMMAGYQTSPQAKFQMQQEIKAANQAATAGGMLGGGAEQKALADYAQQLTARDQQQWLQNMTGIYGQYLSGQRGLAQLGFGAGQQMGGYQTGLGRNLASLLQQRGMAQYGEDVSRYGWLRDLMNVLGTGAGAYFGLKGLGGLGGIGGAAGGAGTGIESAVERGMQGTWGI